MNLDKNEVESDIELAREVIRSGNGNIYQFTNECLRGYIPTFDLRGKDVLTVAASGDHPFNIALGSPKSITCYDINKLAKYWLELKKAVILNMPLDDAKYFFCDFWFDRSLPEEYDELRGKLPKDIEKFWSEVNVCPQLFCDPPAINNMVTFLNMLNYPNSYFDDEFKYRALQSRLREIKIPFIHANLLDLPSQLSGQQFDAIFTSNIGRQIKVPGRSFKDFLQDDLSTLLKPGGVAQVNYHYESGTYDSLEPYDNETAQQKGLRFTRKTFDTESQYRFDNKSSIIKMYKLEERTR